MKTNLLTDVDWYKALRAYFNQQRLDGEQVLSAAGLPPSAEFTQSIKFYNDAVARAFEEMRRQTRNPACGLEDVHALSQLGVLSHVIQAAPTIEQGMVQASRYVRLYWPMATIEFTPGPTQSVMVLGLTSTQEKIPGELYDFFITSIFNAVRMATAAEPQALQVCRPGPKPADAAPWKAAYGCAVTFDTVECSITFDSAYLQRALPNANATLFDFSCKLLAQISEQRGFSIKAQIRSILPGQLARGTVRRETIAAMLDMSERTLCRRIANEGTTFSNLVDELRRDLAESHMKQGYSPTEVAYAIGFSDPSNFYRACRRWFGKTPAHLGLTAEPIKAESVKAESVK